MFMNFTRQMARFLLIGLPLAAVSGLIAQDGIPVFLEPNNATTPVASLDPGQVGLIDSLPVLDDRLAEEGWMFTEYFGTFAGYVNPASVTKSLSLANNTPVFLRPDNNSPVLALIQESDEVEIIRVGTDWTEIEFKKLVPVYFQLPSGEDSMEMTLAPDPVPTPPAREDASTVTVTERELPPEPVVDQPIEVDPLSRTNESAEIEELDPIRSPTLPPPGTYVGQEDGYTPPVGAPAVEIPRMIQGKLRRAGRVFGFKPKYKYELQSGTKKRIAWVDLSDVMVNSLSDYEFKQVVIYGDFESTDSDIPLVRAKTIRLQF
jgi:hypothetical protein